MNQRDASRQECSLQKGRTDQRGSANKTAGLTLNTHTAFEESAAQYAAAYVPYSLCYIIITFFWPRVTKTTLKLLACRFVKPELLV